MNAPRTQLSRLQGTSPSLQPNGKPADGQWTAWVYDAIKEGKYADVIRVLEREQKVRVSLSSPVTAFLTHAICPSSRVLMAKWSRCCASIVS